MYAFAKRPLWILSHVLVAALLITMAWAGVWQLQRHNQRQDLADRIETRAEAPPIELGLVLTSATDPAEYEAIELTHVELDGRWVPGEQVSIRNHSLNGSAGVWVVTPVDLGDGTALAVNRGFVPSGFEVPPAPEGAVHLTGYLQQTQPRGRLGPRDPAEGTLEVLSRVDLERLDQQTELPLLGSWLQMATSVPPPEADTDPLPPPTIEGGPSHLAYSVQWFTFTLIGLIGYPIVLRRMARGSGRSQVPDWDEPVRHQRSGPSPGQAPDPAPRSSERMVRPASGGERWN